MPKTARSGFSAPINAPADGNLCISWDLHQSGWTRALLEPAEAAVIVRSPEIGCEGGAVKSFFLAPSGKAKKNAAASLADRGRRDLLHHSMLKTKHAMHALCQIEVVGGNQRSNAR